MSLSVDKLKIMGMDKFKKIVFQTNAPEKQKLRPNEGTPQRVQMQHRSQQTIQPRQVQKSKENKQPAQMQNAPSSSASAAGVAKLGKTTSVFLDQMIEPMEVIFGTGRAKHYICQDDQGKIIYRVIEENTSFCKRFCLGGQRGFDMTFYDDETKQPAMYLHRNNYWPFMNCCRRRDRVDVYHASNELVGYVREKYACTCRLQFDVNSPDGEYLYYIRGPVFGCGNIHYKVILPNTHTVVGLICRKYPGFVREVFTVADMFSVTFPPKCRIEDRMLLLGTTMLIDFNQFEESQ